VIWVSWRQFRPQAIVAAAALAVIAVLLAATGPGIVSSYRSAGLATCHVNCGASASNFINGVGGLDQALFNATIVIGYLAPALIGIFYGAPLIAREFEAGTYRIAWNQSVTRARWTAIKLGLVGLVGVAAAGLLSLMVSWWANPIDQAAGLGGSASLQRLDPLVFNARGVAPLGYAAFAFAAGVTAGVLLRRTLPAMAITLVVFAAVQFAMPTLVRPHLLPPAHTTAPLNAQSAGISITGNPGSPPVIRVTGNFSKPGAWVLSDATITPSGAALTKPPAACLGPGQNAGPQSSAGGPGQCISALVDMHLRQYVAYQPASRFWPLQGIETGIYLILATGLGVVCGWQVRRKRP
jgi:hypothetical protein